jgi:UDP-N-acetyl-D-mannosaminuronic acid dehydrogenase
MTPGGMKRMKICVRDLGRVGLPTAAMIALGGHEVVGYDVDAAVLRSLGDGAQCVDDPSVRAIVAEALRSGRLTLSAELPVAAQAYVICVPAPIVERRPDLSYLQAALRDVAPLVRPGNLVIVESTLPLGTIERVVVPALRGGGVDPDDIAIAYCPDRATDGAIVEELTKSARVIGGRKHGDAERARLLYASFCTGAFHLTDTVTAELTKVAGDAFRDVNLAFANELAELAAQLGADAHEVIALANRDPAVAIVAPRPAGEARVVEFTVRTLDGRRIAPLRLAASF